MNRSAATSESANGKRMRRSGVGAGVWILVLAALFTGLIYLAASEPTCPGFSPGPSSGRKSSSRSSGPSSPSPSASWWGSFWKAPAGRSGSAAWFGPSSAVAPAAPRPGPPSLRAFVSGILSNTILYTGWQEGRLTRRGLVLGNLLSNSLPMFILHMPTTPVHHSVPHQGGPGCSTCCSCFPLGFRFVGVALAGRLMMPACDACSQEGPAEKRPGADVRPTPGPNSAKGSSGWSSSSCRCTSRWCSWPNPAFSNGCGPKPRTGRSRGFCPWKP